MIFASKHGNEFYSRLIISSLMLKKLLYRAERLEMVKGPIMNIRRKKRIGRGGGSSFGGGEK